MSNNNKSSGGDDIMLCRMTQSHWKDNQMVPTYFVSQKPRRGYYTKIKEAVQRVPPYSRIEIVGGGTFREKIVLDKPLEIGVVKASDPTSICSTSTTLICQTVEAFIEGLMFETESTSTTGGGLGSGALGANNANAVHCCVSVVGGSPIFKWCTMQAVEVLNNATPTIVECKILESKSHGLQIADAAGGTYTRNTIYGHVGYSVYVSSSGEPQLSYNNISLSGLGQICVKNAETGNSNGGSAGEKINPHFLLNRITDSAGVAQSAGVTQENGVLPGYKLDTLEVKEVGMKVNLIANEHFQAEQWGEDMIVDSDGEAILQSTNTRCAVLVSGPSAQPTFTRNTISNCGGNGVSLKGGCLGLFEANYVASNKGWGMVIEGAKTATTLVGNHINSNSGGVKVVSSPVRFAGENVFFGNRGPQLYLLNGHVDFLFQRNIVRSGSRIGVWCSGRGAGNFSQNTFENSGVALRIELQADPLIEDSLFDTCGIGVYSNLGSLGRIQRCNFTDFSVSGCVVITKGDPVFTDCQFALGNVGASVSRDGRGTFLRCLFRDIPKIGLDVSHGGDPVVTECRIKGCSSCGVRASNGGRGTFRDNVIAGHEGVPVFVESNGDPVVERNVIGHSAVDGISIEKGGLGTFVENIIRYCHDSGISVSGELSAPVVRNNYISYCATFGLQVAEAAEGLYERNVIIQCSRANIRLSGRSLLDGGNINTNNHYGGRNTVDLKHSRARSIKDVNSDAVVSSSWIVLRENIIGDSMYSGIAVEKGARALLRGNTITGCAQAVSARGSSTLTMVQNVIESCASGVLCDEDTRLQLFSNHFNQVTGVTICSLGAQYVRATWNVIRECGSGFFLRRVVTGTVSDNVMENLSGYGVYLGTESRVEVTRNKLQRNTVGICLAEMNSKADVFQNTLVDSLLFGIRVAGDHMEKAKCHHNIIIGGDTGICVYRGDVSLAFNILLNCKKGVVLSSLANVQTFNAANTINASMILTSPKNNRLLDRAQRKKQKENKGVVVVPPHGTGGLSSLNGTLNGTLSGTLNLTAAAVPAPSNTTQIKGALLSHCFVSSCSHGGLSVANTGATIEKCVFVHNDIGFHLVGEGASIQLSKTVIMNSAALGVYAEKKSAGSLRGCTLSKNFINVACESDTTLHVSKTVLQSAVAFNSFVSGSLTRPKFDQCLLSSLADISKRQTIGNSNTSGSNNKSTKGAAHGEAEEVNCFQSNKKLLRDLIKTYIRIIGEENTDSKNNHYGGEMNKSADKGGNPYPNQQKSVNFENNANTSEILYSMSSEETERLVKLPSLWEDLYDEPPLWFPRINDDDSEGCQGADTNSTQNIPFPCGGRRSAILWPRNVQSKCTLAGPGGPFFLHRFRTDRTGVTAAAGGGGDGYSNPTYRSDGMETKTADKNSYAYSCSGVWIIESGNPVFENCFIGSHMRVGSSAKLQLSPNFEDGECWRVNPMRAMRERREKQMEEDLRNGVFTIYTSMSDTIGENGAVSSLLSPVVEKAKKKNSVDKKKKKKKNGKKGDADEGDIDTTEINDKQGSKERDDGQEADDDEENNVGEATYDPPLRNITYSEGKNAAAVVPNITLLGQLLLLGSPCYWRQYASSNTYFFSINDKIVDSSKQTYTNYSNNGKRTCSVSATMTEHISGYGVLSTSNAAGTFTNCLFDTNQHAARLGLGSRTVFKRCRFLRQSGEAVLLEERSRGQFLNCLFKDTHSLHVRIRGPSTAPLIEGNDFTSETPFTAIICEDRTTPQLLSNKFRSIQNDVIVVQGGSAPEIGKNALEGCKSGILICEQSAGKVYSNSFIEMTEYAIMVKDTDTRVSVEENSITGGRASGIIVTGYGAAPSIISNNLDENKKGIVLLEGAGGTYTGNLIRRHDIGIFVQESAGYFEKNNVFESIEEGIKITGTYTNAFFINNSIQSGKRVGVSISGGRGILRLNKISLQAENGVVIEGGPQSQYFLVGNEVYNNNGCGLLISDKSAPTLYCNVVAENRLGGLTVTGTDTNPKIDGNYFKNNFKFGVTFREGATGKMHSSVIAATQDGAAMIVDDEASPSLQDTIFNFNSNGGLFVLPGGCCVALRCLFIQNTGEPACVLKSSENGITKLIGCVFAENTLSLQALSSANAEISASAFLGASNSGAVTVSVGSDASPSFTHCLFAQLKCGIQSSGFARLKRCVFYDCVTGVDIQDGGTSLFECELLAGGIGVSITGGQPNLMGSLFASCGKSGIHISGVGAPSVTECGILRCAKGVNVEGNAMGAIENNRILWNQENVTLGDNTSTLIKGNLIYDAASIGIHVKNGSPQIIDNTVFDNHYAGVAVDCATGGKLESNEIFFPREDGALVVKDKGEAKKVFTATSNTLRNTISPPGCANFKNLQERMQMYKGLENTKEKSYSNYIDIRKLVDECASTALLRLTEMVSRAVSCCHKPGWLLKEGTPSVCSPKNDAEKGAGEAGLLAVTVPQNTSASPKNPAKSPGNKDVNSSNATAGTSAANPSSKKEDTLDSNFEPFAVRWEKLPNDVLAAARASDSDPSVVLPAYRGTTSSPLFRRRETLEGELEEPEEEDKSPSSIKVSGEGSIGTSRRPSAMHVDSTSPDAISAHSPAQSNRRNSQQNKMHASGKTKEDVSTVKKSNTLPTPCNGVVLYESKASFLRILDSLLGPSTGHSYEALLQREPFASANGLLLEVRLRPSSSDPRGTAPGGSGTMGRNEEGGGRNRKERKSGAGSPIKHKKASMASETASNNNNGAESRNPSILPPLSGQAKKKKSSSTVSARAGSTTRLPTVEKTGKKKKDGERKSSTVSGTAGSRRTSAVATKKKVRKATKG